MKQIKTIFTRIDKNEEFDKLVNAALHGGWKLVKRDVIIPHVSDRYTLLYAELEKVTILPEERGCDNCRYKDRDGDQTPCFNCDSVSHWKEPRT